MSASEPLSADDSTTTQHVLVLCTHNSARSQLAEALINHWAARLGAAVRAYSAGSQPSGRVHPLALEALTDAGVGTEGLRSKTWDAFASDANVQTPTMRVVMTVCDSAAKETCPVWPGAPVMVHWGYADPSAEADETAQRTAFAQTRDDMSARIQAMLALPWDSLSDQALQQAITGIPTNIQ